jgi:putative membrane protein
MPKKYLTIAVSLLLVFWFIPLNAQTPPADQTPPSTNTPGTHDMKSMQGGKAGSDGEAIAFLLAVDQSEIEAGNDASSKKSDPQVGQYAQQMVSDHTKHKDETQKLSDSLSIAPAETATIEKMKAKSKTDLAKLSQMQGANFDRAYMSQMVKDHSDVLNHLDHYIKSTTNTQLQSHLKTTRDTVAQHLADAKKIQGSLKNNSSSK